MKIEIKSDNREEQQSRVYSHEISTVFIDLFIEINDPGAIHSNQIKSFY